jgi:hypothetical protein
MRRSCPFQLHVECLCCGQENRLPLIPYQPIRAVCSECGEPLYLVGPISGHIVASAPGQEPNSLQVAITLFR